MHNQVMHDTEEVVADLTELAKQRNEVLLQSQNYDGYLTPLAYESPDGSVWYGIQLPQCFPTMTEPDACKILKWYVGEGFIVQRGRLLLEIQTNYGDIVIPMPPTLRGRYRVVRIVKAQGEQVRMGNMLIILQAVSAHKTTLKVA